MKSQIIITCDEKNYEGDYLVEYVGDQLAMQRGVIALLQNDMKFRCFFIECLLHSIGQSEVKVTKLTEKEGSYERSNSANSANSADSKRN